MFKKEPVKKLSIRIPMPTLNYHKK